MLRFWLRRGCRRTCAKWGLPFLKCELVGEVLADITNLFSFSFFSLFGAPTWSLRRWGYNRRYFFIREGECLVEVWMEIYLSACLDLVAESRNAPISSSPWRSFCPCGLVSSLFMFISCGRKKNSITCVVRNCLHRVALQLGSYLQHFDLVEHFSFAVLIRICVLQKQVVGRNSVLSLRKGASS